MTEKIDPTCHKCNSISHCAVGRASKTLDNCPMKVSPEIYKEARQIYETNEFIKKSTNVASIVEAQGYISYEERLVGVDLLFGRSFDIGLPPLLTVTVSPP